MDCSGEILSKSHAPSPLPVPHPCPVSARARCRRISPFRQSRTIPPRFSCLCSALRCKNARPACASSARLTPKPSDKSSCTNRQIRPRRSVHPKFGARPVASHNTSHRTTNKRHQVKTNSASQPHNSPSTWRESERSQSRDQGRSFSPCRHWPRR